MLDGTELPAAPSAGSPCSPYDQHARAAFSPPFPTFKSIHTIKEVKLHRLTWEACLMRHSSLSARVFALTHLYVLERNV